MEKKTVEVPHLRAIDRQQMVFRPVDVDKLIEADHAARGIWELVGNLDLTSFYEGIEVVEGEAGRPAHDPRLLLSLWLYSYSIGVASAREIARLCAYHPAYQWLTGLGEVNYHTLSDFRLQHEGGLQKLASEILGVLSAEGLVQLRCVAHDGTKVRANAGSDTFRREKTLRAHIAEAQEQIQQLEREAESEEASKRRQAARERAARERKQRLEQALQQLEQIRAHSDKAEEECRASETDPQARVMKHGDGGYHPSYNVQISTDVDSGVIVGWGVSQSPQDQGLLPEAVERIVESTGRLPEQVIVDEAFVTGQTIVEIADKGVELIGPEPDKDKRSSVELNGIDSEFRAEAFTYVAEENYFICPAGKRLNYKSSEKHRGGIRHRYQAKAQDCQSCPFKTRCCPKASKGRLLMRQVDSPAVVAYRQNIQTEQAKEIYNKRGAVAEFSNLWIKAKIQLRQFSLRGLVKVNTEALWVCLTYNIQQWLRLCWRSKQLANCTA